MRAIARIGFSTVLLLVVALAAGLDGEAVAAPRAGKTIVVCYPDGTCVTKVVDTGHDKSAGASDGGGGKCAWKGKSVPCTTASGSFNSRHGCYYRDADPYPTTGPVAVEYQQHGGAIYWATCPFGGSGGYVWLPQPPPGMGPTPGQLARQALASLTLTKPSTGRYPAGTLHNGQPYTVVRAYTWYFTDPNDFTTLTARAAVGGVWARVTVRPTALTFTPGDGNRAVSCAGPGTAWNPSYGPWAPSPTGCDYRYQHSSIHEPNGEVTATYGIRWQVTWVGSGNTSGSLADQTTTSTSTFVVAEVESVVTN